MDNLQSYVPVEHNSIDSSKAEKNNNNKARIYASNKKCGYLKNVFKLCKHQRDVRFNRFSLINVIN